jgi:Ca2+-binding RTX toxin-like protein
MVGGAGADKFVFAATDSGTTFVTTDVITDWTGGTDTLAINGAGSVTNYSEVGTAADYTTALGTANTVLGANLSLKYVVVQVGTDTLVFFDGDGGHAVDGVIALAGRTLADISETSFVA